MAQTLNDSYSNEMEREEFFETLNLQLRGEAKDVINNIFNSEFEEIKGTLLHHFAYLNNRDIICSQLENLRQETNETISAYANRTRKLLREKNLIYSHLTNDQKLEHNRLARKHFCQGIANQTIRNRLLIRGANSLEDAIAHVIEAEHDILNTIQNNELFCRHCRANGHREKDCSKKSENQNGLTQLLNALRNSSTQRSYNNQNQYNRQNSFNRQNNLRDNNNYNWRNSNNDNWRINNNGNSANNTFNQYRSNQTYNRNENQNTRNYTNNNPRNNQQFNRNENQLNRRQQQSNINRYQDSDNPDTYNQNYDSQREFFPKEHSEN